MKYFIYMCIGGSSSTQYTGDDSSERSKWYIPSYHYDKGEKKPKLFDTKEEAEAKRIELQHARDTEERYFVNGTRIDNMKYRDNGLVCVGESKYPNFYG